MLTDARIHATIATSDLEKAKAWYAEKVGWTPVRHVPGMLVYDIDGSILTVFQSDFAGTARNTVASWEVRDVRGTVDRLQKRGVVFEEFDLEGFTWSEGVATGEFGEHNAWFRDADGNYITIVATEPEADRRFAAKFGITKPLPPAEPGVRPLLAGTDLHRARSWYEDRLGLAPYLEVPGENLLYWSGATRFGMYATPSAGSARNTVAMWWVEDLRGEVDDLRARGVEFEDYDFGDARTLEGVLEDEGGLTAWFKDSEGNILGIGQYVEVADLTRTGRSTASV